MFFGFNPGLTNEQIDAYEAETADLTEYGRAVKLADQAFQRQELEMSCWELIYFGDSLDAHLDGPTVYDMEGWLEEFEQKASERGWPEANSFFGGKVIVELNRERLRENVVLFTVFLLRRVRRESLLPPAERERIAREILADDALAYSGDGHAGHQDDEDYNFDDYQGPENPRVVNGFNHPATGGETGILSNWSLASDLDEGDVPIDFRAFQGSPMRVRSSVARGRRA